MQTTTRPFPGALTHLAACGLLIGGALVMPASALAAESSARSSAIDSSAAGPAAMSAVADQAPGTALAAVAPAAPTNLSSHVTDEAGILDASTAQSAVDAVAGTGASLWIVTMNDSSQTASEYAAQAWDASGFGTTDLILVINVPDSGDITYAFDGSQTNSVWSDDLRTSTRSEILSNLRAGDYNGAVSAVADAANGSSSSSGGSDSSGSSGGSSIAAPLIGGAVVVGGGALAYSAYSRRKKASGTGVARTGSTPATQPLVPVAQLQVQAGNALVTADDAVRAADEELSYAKAQFGLSATDAFTQALGTAREHVARSFELRKLLDDSIPETEGQQRQMYGEILDRCGQAMAVISAQEKEFKERRGLEANLPASIAETAQRATETEQAIASANTLLVTLHASYADVALTSVDAAPAQAEKLLAAGRTALDQAKASADAGQQSTAVEQVRIAQGSVAQAGELAAQVTRARERLASASTDLQRAIASISSDLTDAQRLGAQIPTATLQPLVADAEAAVSEGRAASGATPSGDPLAALDHLARAEAAIDGALAPARAREENDSRARSSLASRLSRLSSQVEAVTSYITTHRGAVGSSARTALSEASRHAAAATSLQSQDPQAALAEVAAAEPLIAQAQRLAEADVRNNDNSWGGGSGTRVTGGGLDLGSLVLGGILLGGGRGGYGGWGGPPRGGFGGGGFGGGGFGGGFGGGGGGFGGGGGGGGFGGGGGRV